MATGILETGAPSQALPQAGAEERFYQDYRWCLNPMLSLRDLLKHLDREIERYRSNGDSGWQGEERRINLYLFACAIACTLDDYLAARPRVLSALARRFPGAGIGIRAAAALANAPARNAHVAAWRRQWADCVDAACELLLGGDGERFCEQARHLLAAAPSVFRETAQRQRMRIPEAFRCQDLTHQDVCAMVRLCLPALPEKDRPIAIVGPRTAGAYFAPLAAARLRALGYTRVAWVTVRPKNGLSRGESHTISKLLRARAQVLIIDDHPNSGHTLRLLLGELRSLGAASHDIVVALPGHPSIPNWTVADEAASGVSIRMLPPEDRLKARLLNEQCVASDATTSLNRELAAHFADGFQVRLKRVLESDSGRVMAKSVGWGWLGYHAWLAGAALEGFVPRPLRLRDGILYSEYEDSSACSEACPTALAGYVARRVNKLALGEDPAFDSLGYRWCGWDDLVATLSRVYGPYLGPLKKRAIRRLLRAYVAPHPTLVDGRMKPADWVHSGDKPLKTDFEHHNFGGGEPDVVDPAWDLACAIFEFHLAPDAEQILLDTYTAQTADSGIHDRLPLYKILYAMNGLRTAKYWLARKPNDPRREEWNRQFTATRSFAAFHLARYCGRKLGAPPAAWERRLCFLDLDGVLDWGLLGFPHTSPCGVQALRMLRRSRFSVVLNTARSLEHVREYCRAYRLPGGVAELGSVFWDAIRDWEIPLIDTEAATQIERLREEIRTLAGVFIDPENKYSIRAYRFQDGFMRPLQSTEVAAVLARTDCHRLTFVQSRADTYIVQKGSGKGQALASVHAYLGYSGEAVAAIGDSAPDVEMLRTAEIAYAPANASREVRELIARGECRKTSRPLQAGLLQAAMELCLAAGHNPDEPAWRDETEPVSLLDELLRAPDRHPVARIFNALRWRGL
ncbi:MAG: HAD hydrolase family protein [Bryobacteraceae bacterium]|jgi:hydroxymethylpyrimidine pyrophosphatase-like HAD family hydrolase/adenine/guanine phosphoribosyltransferase-like PRPP-binding protein